LSTGADSARPGLLEAATDGTIFLDEIVDMPASLQVKLLRVLEGHEFLRVGGTRPITSRARFLAAPNKAVSAAVAGGSFREDLYYRLNVLSIMLPPLRDRGAAVLLLADHFLDFFAKRAGARRLRLADETRQTLSTYAWPGNVRELKNVIERAVILCKGEEISPSDLRLGEAVAGPSGSAPAWLELPYRDARDEFEKQYVAHMLKTCGGNVSQTAERIGLDRKNLQDKIKKSGLNAQSSPGAAAPRRWGARAPDSVKRRPQDSLFTRFPLARYVQYLSSVVWHTVGSRGSNTFHEGHG